MDTLQQHRLAELESTGRPLSSFAACVSLTVGQRCAVPGLPGLELQPLRSRHAETCSGLLLYWQNKPVLGWTADSGYCEVLYQQLSAAPVVLLDGRATGSSEHAGFVELQTAASSGVLRASKCCVYGYGRLADAPAPGAYPSLIILKPGQRLPLASRPPQTKCKVRRKMPAGPAVATGDPDAVAAGLHEAHIASLERCLMLSDDAEGLQPADTASASPTAPQEAEALQLV